MNLIIDVGNTFVKMAVFEKGALLKKVRCKREDFVKAFTILVESYRNISQAILSSVGSFEQEYLTLITQNFPLVTLSQQTKVPFINLYATPSTLGVDRIALVSGAASQYPEENVLVIDAGSCITYDFLTDQNEYLGGAISPGLRMRYKAMHVFTENLPLLETETPKNSIGDSTQNSMHIGVVEGVAREIEGFIDAYIEKAGKLTVILTGGDAHFLRDSIKNDIFANSNFLLEGLNYILEFNNDSC
ncbi:MAG: type III pantothenate kinase [Bacteroidetes bacterium]|nr:type III pantothenate kinase [Bacteroidota bacterium]